MDEVVKTQKLSGQVLKVCVVRNFLWVVGVEEELFDVGLDLAVNVKWFKTQERADSRKVTGRYCNFHLSVFQTATWVAHSRHLMRRYPEIVSVQALPKNRAGQWTS